MKTRRARCSRRHSSAVMTHGSPTLAAVRSCSVLGTTSTFCNGFTPKEKPALPAGFFWPLTAALARLISCNPHPQPRKIRGAVGAANQFESLPGFRFLTGTQVRDSQMQVRFVGAL